MVVPGNEQHDYRQHQLGYNLDHYFDVNGYYLDHVQRHHYHYYDNYECAGILQRKYFVEYSGHARRWHTVIGERIGRL